MQLAQSIKKQDLKVGMIEQRIGEDLDQLCNDDISLTSMFEHDDILLVYMTQAIENLHSSTINFRPNIDNFDDLIINVDVQPDASDSIKQALDESQQITLDTLRDEESHPNSLQNTICLDDDDKEILEQLAPEHGREERKSAAITSNSLFLKDEHWLCTNCGQRQESVDIICLKCLKFKPLSFYPNLTSDPGNVTHKELKALRRRRKLERKLVIEAEKTGQSLQSSSTVWFIISNKWLYKWKCFMQNQVTLNNFFDNEEWAAQITLSTNSEIGVLPPGLISNEEDLFEEEEPDDQPERHNKKNSDWVILGK